MKTFPILAALGAALAIPVTAAAADSPQRTGAGHYEWRTVPQAGPRSGGPAVKRVRVAKNREMADCNCEMMKMSAAECMRSVPGNGDRPRAG